MGRGRHRYRRPDLGGRSCEVRQKMNTPAISIKGMVKRYGDTTAVAGIALEIGQGEVFGLLGPIVAGETTTILMRLGLTEITEGQVSVVGLDPRRHVREPTR